MRRIGLVVAAAGIGVLGLAGLAHASDSDDTGNDGTRYGGHAGPFSGTDPAESQYNFGVGPNAGSEPHGVGPTSFGDQGLVHSVSPNQDHQDASYGERYKYDPDATYNGETWDYHAGGDHHDD